MKKTLVPEKLYSKGYDNSGANDEEVNDDSEYSDDEAEAEAKRKKNPKQRKRKEKETGGGGVSASKLWEGFVPKHQLPGHSRQQNAGPPMQPPIGQMAFTGWHECGSTAIWNDATSANATSNGGFPAIWRESTRAGVDFIPPPGDSVNAPPPPPPSK